MINENSLFINISASLGVLTDATADTAVTLLLATTRRVSEAMQAVRVSGQNDNELIFFLLIILNRTVNGVHHGI
jgi:lactate dehydrogenase-like 2-hydroxyacid dehydrogenase